MADGGFKILYPYRKRKCVEIGSLRRGHDEQLCSFLVRFECFEGPLSKSFQIPDPIR